MKNLFYEYYPLSELTLKKLFKQAIIVFDTSALLNFYQYSNETTKLFFEILKKNEDRLWLPNKVAEEYLRKRISVLYKQKKIYDDFSNKITNLKNDLESPYSQPFITTEIQKEFNIIYENILKEIKQKEFDYNKDYIFDSFTKIFNRKIGKPFNKNELGKIYKEGEQRFKNKVPPGFEDFKKKGTINILI